MLFGLKYGNSELQTVQIFGWLHWFHWFVCTTPRHRWLYTAVPVQAISLAVGHNPGGVHKLRLKEPCLNDFSYLYIASAMRQQTWIKHYSFNCKNK
jgi:hypothetical protein